MQHLLIRRAVLIAGSFTAAVARAKTIVWNGPMGVFEFPNYATGSKRFARTANASQPTFGSLLDAVIAVTSTGATTIIGAHVACPVLRL